MDTCVSGLWLYCGVRRYRPDRGPLSGSYAFPAVTEKLFGNRCGTAGHCRQHVDVFPRSGNAERSGRCCDPD